MTTSWTPDDAVETHLRTVRALGVSVRIESDDPDLIDLLGESLGDLPTADDPSVVIRVRRVDGGSGHEVAVVDIDGHDHVIEDDVGPAILVEVILEEIDDLAIRSTDLVVLPAVVVSGPLGAAMLCRAKGDRSRELAAAAARRGWGLVSGELAVIDTERGVVIPYPHAIPEDDGAGVRRWWSAAALGAEVVHDAQPIVAAVRLVGGDETTIGPISRASNLYGLVQGSLSLGRRGATEFAALERFTATVPGYELAVSAADLALDLVAPLIGRSAERGGATAAPARGTARLPD